jgi:hypothetical protein
LSGDVVNRPTVQCSCLGPESTKPSATVSHGDVFGPTSVSVQIGRARVTAAQTETSARHRYVVILEFTDEFRS